MWTSLDHRITHFQSFLCGSIAGVLSRTLTAPLDVVKISCQVKGSQIAMHSVCKQIFELEGFRGFFRGNLTSCVKIFPYYGVQVWSYRKFRWYISDDLGRLNIYGSVSAATLSALSATLFTYPLDVIKTRLVVQPYGNRKVYESISHAFLTIMKTESLRTLYNGLSPTLLGSYLFIHLTVTKRSMGLSQWSVSGYIQEMRWGGGVHPGLHKSKASGLVPALGPQRVKGRGEPHPSKLTGFNNLETALKFVR